LTGGELNYIVYCTDSIKMYQVLLKRISVHWVLPTQLQLMMIQKISSKRYR